MPAHEVCYRNSAHAGLPNQKLAELNKNWECVWSTPENLRFFSMRRLKYTTTVSTEPIWACYSCYAQTGWTANYWVLYECWCSHDKQTCAAV